MATYRKPERSRTALTAVTRATPHSTTRFMSRSSASGAAVKTSATFPSLRRDPRGLERRMSQDLRAALRKSTVGELMTQQVMSVRPSTALGDVADALLEFELGALPVVDGDGPVQGLVTRADVLRCLRPSSTPAPSRSGTTGGASDHDVAAAALLARHVMRNLPFRFTPNYRLDLAVATMAFHSEHHAPVQSRSGDLVGMLTSEDVLHWVAAELGYAMDFVGLAETGDA